MNGRVAELETQFSQKLTEATAAKAPLFATREALAGLSEDEIKAAADARHRDGPAGQVRAGAGQHHAAADAHPPDQPRDAPPLFEASVNRTSGGDQYDLTGADRGARPTCARAAPRCSASRTTRPTRCTTAW